MPLILGVGPFNTARVSWSLKYLAGLLQLHHPALLEVQQIRLEGKENRGRRVHNECDQRNLDAKLCHADKICKKAHSVDFGSMGK